MSESEENDLAPESDPELESEPGAADWTAGRAGFKSGTVALVGRPNAGKSTLMNQLLAEKVAIVSDKPQTTRNRLVGILTDDEVGQIVFYDTPGVHKPQHQMNRQMIKSAQEALNDADVVCLLVDASQSHGGGDEFMLQWLETTTAPKIVLLNKIDRVAKPKLLPRMAIYHDTELFDEIIPISALRADGTDLVLDILWSKLPEGPPIYDPELLTVHPERFLAAERIREKVLEITKDELPFATAVVIERWEEKTTDDGLPVLVIHASILAERPGQKKILIGAGGSVVKQIGIAAREDLEDYFEARVFLDLNIRLEPKWRENPRILNELEAAPYAVGLG